MKNKLQTLKEHKTYVISLLVFILIFGLSNNIVACLAPHKLHTSQRIEPLQTTDQYSLAVKSIENLSDLLQNVKVTGWIWFDKESNAPAPEALTLYLQSDKATYETSTKLTRYEETVTRKSDINIYQFEATFSIINLKDTTYQLHLGADLSDGAHMLGDLNFACHKKFKTMYAADGVEEVNLMALPQGYATLVNPIEATYSDLLKTSTDVYLTESGSLRIRGWALLHSHSTYRQQVFVEVKQEDGSVETYAARRIQRRDVSINLRMPLLYDYSGIDISIPSDYTVGELLTYTVIIQNGSELCASAPQERVVAAA